MGEKLNSRPFQRVFKSLDRDVVAVLLVFLIWQIPWGLISPFLSPYFFELSEGDYFLTGLLNGIPYFTMVFSVFVFGWVVDKIGPKKIMVAGFGIFITLVFTLIFITDPLLFFIYYVLMYSLLGCFNPAVLKYASLTRKTDIFGSMGAVASFGFFIGSVASGWIYEMAGGMNLLFVLSLLFCTAGLITALSARDLRNSEQKAPVVISPATSQQPVVSSAVIPPVDAAGNPVPASFKEILVGSKILVVLFVIAFVHSLQTAFSGIFATIYFLDELSTPALLIGITLGAATLSGAFASHYTGKIAEKRGYKEILIISYLAYSLVWCGFFFSTGYLIPVLLYILPVYVGLFVAGPALVSERVPEARRGTFLGVLSASQYTGFAAGSILGGLLGALLGSLRWNFGVSTVLSLAVVAIIIVFLKEEKKAVVYREVTPVVTLEG